MIRMRASGPHPFASPHTVRRSLADPRQSSALFGGVFRCARADYRRLTSQITKRRHIPFPQVGHSHNPLVAGPSPARLTSALTSAQETIVSTAVGLILDGAAGRVSVVVAVVELGRYRIAPVDKKQVGDDAGRCYLSEVKLAKGRGT